MARHVRGMTIYLNDVLKIHVDAFKPKIVGNQDFSANSGGVDGVTFNDALDIARKPIPKDFAAGVLPNSGSTPTLHFAIGTAETERTIGFKFAGLAGYRGRRAVYRLSFEGQQWC